ncbi:Clcn7 [Symbiodinium microadriaticum]|nr:Clcn7 [Symbiodinium sp. KB8]CAE7650731.1 Clcn7 [Symbiodinium microadriaticum]
MVFTEPAPGRSCLPSPRCCFHPARHVSTGPERERFTSKWHLRNTRISKVRCVRRKDSDNDPALGLLAEGSNARARGLGRLQGGRSKPGPRKPAVDIRRSQEDEGISPCRQPSTGTTQVDYGIGTTPNRQTSACWIVAKWVAVILIGIVTGLVASAIDYGIEFFTKFRFGLMEDLVKAGTRPWLLMVIHVVFCTCLASIAGALVCFVSPLAAGSGIPEVKCRLNGIDLPLVVKSRTLLAKACGVLFSVSAGLPCGKEGPMIHSGAIIGALFSQYVVLGSNMLRDIELRDLITAGGAAGVAAAFGAPIGGMLFALEEGSSFWNGTVLLQALLCSSASALTLNLFLGGFDSIGFGTLGALGVLTFGDYFEGAKTSYHIWELPFFVTLGLLGGLVGAGFNALNIPLTLWRIRRVRASGWTRFLEVLLVSACIAAVFFVPAMLSRKCYVTGVEHGSHKPGELDLICKDTLAGRTGLGLFVTPSEDAIKVLFHDPHMYDPGLLSLFGIIYFLLACWTYGLGVPSGLFVPSLLVGAVLGRLVGQSLQLLSSRVAPPGMYALVGAGATLAGMARITVSLGVILIEATGNTQYSLPILFAVIVARSVGNLFNEGIYDIHIQLKHIPFLPADAAHGSHALVSGIMTADVATVGSVESVTRLERILETSHNAFPVVEPGTSQYCGMLSRSALLKLLQRVSCPLDQSEAMPSRGSSLLGPQTEVDLNPYINAGAYTIEDTATVRRAYVLFRTMGLRHLPVVRGGCKLCGILTRKDFLERVGGNAFGQVLSLLLALWLGRFVLEMNLFGTEGTYYVSSRSVVATTVTQGGRATTNIQENAEIRTNLWNPASNKT